MADPDIFLSYNREDAQVARRFADAFAAEGFDVWWDQALRSGEAYDEVTEAALRGAKAVVVLWSPRSVVSRWVRAEASIADENGTLAPVMIEPSDLPVMFRLTQTADLTGWQGGADDKAWRGFLGDVRRMVGKAEPQSAAKPEPAHAPAESGMPNVALVPFTHRGGGEEMEFLAEDLTEEITRELARSRYFKVIAARTMAAWRGKAFDYSSLGQELDARYLVEGKLQRAGESIRLTLQLVDAETANVIWSPRFTGKAEDIAEDPEEFQATITSQAREQIIRLEMDRAMAKQGPLSGWDHVLRAKALTRRESDSGSERLEEARRAVAAAPHLGMAHAMLAQALSQFTRSTSVIDDTTIAEAREHIQRAMRLDGDNASVLVMLAGAYSMLGDGETGLRLALRAAKLDPNTPDSQFQLGAAHYFLGNAAGAIEALRKMDRLASADGMSHMALQILGVCLCVEGQWTEAEAALDRAQALNPNFGSTFRWKAIAAAQQGKDAETRSALTWLRKVDPGFSCDEHVHSMLRVPGMAPHMGEAVAIFRRIWEATEPEG